MFNAVKDAMTSRAALVFINTRIARYGRVEELKIDTRGRTAEATCLLHGESTPISFKLTNYTVETVGKKKFVQVGEFSCTRPWLQSLLDDFAKNRRIELPPWAAGLL